MVPLGRVGIMTVRNHMVCPVLLHDNLPVVIMLNPIITTGNLFVKIKFRQKIRFLAQWGGGGEVSLICALQHVYNRYALPDKISFICQLSFN